MGWKDHLKRLKNEVEQLIAEPGSQNSQQSQAPPPQQQQQQQQQYAPPPQQQPMGGQPGHVYWQPQFRPDVPVTQDWDAKIGNGPDGWGNQELQHYTAEQQNAFHTPDGKLVLRAVANNSCPNPEQKYTSARIVSRQTLARDQGVLTAVILSPCAKGIWPAFWLLPQEPFAWPTDGEVDIAETWNGDCENHSCLHWGQHHEPDKHRVLGTKIPDMQYRPVRYDLAWVQPGGQPGQGRMIWYIDGRPVMKGDIPPGTRPMRDMTILLNVAMGGNVCGGKTPRDGYYDMVVHQLYMGSEPEYGGWQRFENDWADTQLGNTY
ncbi:Glucan endo-1,3-beta-glucosidase A1-like protein 1 [Colletotrichum chrysophilum]|uniref:Glucan endo-1,3-beta-glucosidase A1-like protein 1 n=1 Tax=Colletotrichum chrysophilum TaxID=1836956 RepID=A0AAD9AAI1_9PEZI|nr:Glucan endo-1,3-beta-glucosidase A1-like protein 1 [Colletotrichum chrysophilum]